MKGLVVFVASTRKLSCSSRFRRPEWCGSGWDTSTPRRFDPSGRTWSRENFSEGLAEIAPMILIEIMIVMIVMICFLICLILFVIFKRLGRLHDHDEQANDKHFGIYEPWETIWEAATDMNWSGKTSVSSGIWRNKCFLMSAITIQHEFMWQFSCQITMFETNPTETPVLGMAPISDPGKPWSLNLLSKNCTN